MRIIFVTRTFLVSLHYDFESIPTMWVEKDMTY